MPHSKNLQKLYFLSTLDFIYNNPYFPPRMEFLLLYTKNNICAVYREK